jgi:hypothetical protein
MYCRSDFFVCGLVLCFSSSSGYLTVLIYEYTAAGRTDNSSKSTLTALLNICFQLAAFVAVLLSVIITSTFTSSDSYSSEVVATDDMAYRAVPTANATMTMAMPMPPGPL